ncbi:MAG: hypothetical protein WBX02_15000 [Terriglobales bacterium]
MTTAWKSESDNKKPTNNTPANRTTKTISGTTLSSWSRQQKFAMIAGFAILAVLLAASACSKQSSKPALVSASSPAASSPAPTVAELAPVPVVVPPASARKAARKRPANVTYTDASSGISFLYPRKALLISGDKVKPDLGGVDDTPANVPTSAPMNFAQPGGVTIATVALPDKSYPGTDFASAFFNVNVNRGLSEQECEHFAFVDTRNPDGEPVDAEKVKVGATEMAMTSNFSANAIKQDETQYYHSYQNGACYEYVLGLGTEGFATEGGIRHVNRDEVFAKLEKILATVKVNPAVEEHAAEPPANGMTSGKE